MWYRGARRYGTWISLQTRTSCLFIDKRAVSYPAIFDRFLSPRREYLLESVDGRYDIKEEESRNICFFSPESIQYYFSVVICL